MLTSSLIADIIRFFVTRKLQKIQILMTIVKPEKKIFISFERLEEFQ